MTLSELKEKIKKFLPFAVPALTLGSFGLVIYFAFFHHPRPEPQPPVTLPRSEASAYSFAWSQDGTEIYYFSAEQGESPLRVLKVEAGSILEDNIVGAGISTATDVFWSPTNSALVLSRLELTGELVYNIVDFGNGDSVPVTLGDSVDVYSWSPDGTKIAYITSPDQNDKSNINLFSVGNLELYEENLLEESLESIEQIFWADDGKKLFIIARPSLPGEAPVMPQLYLLNLETKELELLVPKDGGYFAFVPHADGDVLLLSTEGISLMDSGSREIAALFEISLHPYSTTCAWLDGEMLFCRLVDFSTGLGSGTFWKMNSETLQKQRVSGIPVEGVGSLFTLSPNGDLLAYFDEENFIKVIAIE